MRRKVDMVCISPTLLDSDIDTMIKISEKIPVVTCVKNIFEEKATFTHFVCLLNCDELSAYSEEERKRNFKRKKVVVVHDDPAFLKKAKSFNYITVHIGEEHGCGWEVDYQFASLEDMYDYEANCIKKDKKIGYIFAILLALQVFLLCTFGIEDALLVPYLLLMIVPMVLAIYFFRISLVDIILEVLDALF